MFWSSAPTQYRSFSAENTLENEKCEQKCGLLVPSSSLLHHPRAALPVVIVFDRYMLLANRN